VYQKERKAMYESPKLNQVGEARDIVLGLLPTGDDIDANWVEGNFEFAAEEDIEDE
jgi:hypothetical protein